MTDNSTSNEKGRTVTFRENTRLSLEALPSGNYLNAAVISDSRGDSYYSAVIGSRMAGSTMSGWAVDSRFYGRAYD